MKRIGQSVGLGVALVVAAAGLFAGCGGGDDDEGGPSGGGSFTSIQSAIESPTGTVDETTAEDVAVEFAKVSSVNSAAGTRRGEQTAQAGTGTSACPAGGSIDASGNGGQSSGEASISYDECCLTAGCCVDGAAQIFYSTDQSAPYMYCGSYDLTYDCEGTSAVLEYEGCISSSGQEVFVVEVDGDTYSVSGSYSNGSGTLEIRGANGTWTCTYSDDGGSCTGSSGSFDF